MIAEQSIRIPVSLPKSTAVVSAELSATTAPWAVMALAHGAGADHRHPFLRGLAGALAAEGVAVLRFAFPHSEAGRRMPGPAAHAVATWSAVQDVVQAGHGVPFFAAGKSYGGRMASMAAAEGAIDPAGLLYLGYPLHPPGDPSKPRAAHLPQIAAPQLFIEGTADPFIDPHEQLAEAVRSCQNAQIAWIDAAGHSFEVKGRPRPADQIGAELAPTLVDWMRSLSGS